MSTNSYQTQPGPGPEVDVIFVLGGSASGKTYAVENTLLSKYPDYSELYAIDGGDFREALSTYTVGECRDKAYEKLFKSGGQNQDKKNLNQYYIQEERPTKVTPPNVNEVFQYYDEIFKYFNSFDIIELHDEIFKYNNLQSTSQNINAVSKGSSCL